MPTYILRPNGDGGTTGPAWTYSSGSTAYNLLNDSSNLTYIQAGGTSERTYSLTLANATGTIPGGEVIVAVQPFLQLYDARSGLNENSVFDAKVGIFQFGQALAEGATWHYGQNGQNVVIKGPRCTQVPGMNVDWTHALVDDLFFWIRSQVATSYYDAYIVVETIATGTVTVTAPTGTIADRTPNVTWTYSLGAQHQGGYRVKIFSSAQYSAGGFDPLTSTPTASVESLNNGSQVWTCPSLLADGAYRAYVWVNHIGTGNWYGGTYSGFTVSDPVGTPTSVTPAATSVQSASWPTFRATAPVQTGGASVQIEFIVATDSGFTNNTQTFITSASTTTGQPLSSPPTSRMPQGTWYVKARAKDQFGTYGSYSAANSFTISHPPAPANMSPSSGMASAYSTTKRVSWDFTDPANSGIGTLAPDTQTAYQVQIGKGTNYTATIDTGTVASATAYYDATIDSSYKDVDIWWRVRVRDTDSVWSDWSASQIFRTSDAPTVAITSPTNNGTVNSPSPTFTWTFTASGGRTQAMFKVVVVNTDSSATVYDSGWLTGASLSHTMSSSVIALSTNYSVTVTVQDNTGIQGSATNAFTATYSLPASVTPTLDSSTYSTTGKVNLTWATAADGAFVAWRIYRRVAGATTWTLLSAITTSSTKTYDDYLAPTDTALEYAVVHAAVRFSDTVESAYIPVSFQGTNTYYTLVCPSSPTLNCVLHGVTGDQFNDDIDTVTLDIIGRGRVFQQGTKYGKEGTLDIAFNDRTEITARAQRLAVEALRDSGRQAYLRNPFGDVWAVALVSLSISRVPGIGQREHSTCQIKYTEVATT